MSTDRVYLRPNVTVEPLVDQWLAWSHLIPPANPPRNLTERHFKIVDSDIANPHVHAAAVKNPKMLGGPFIDYGGMRIDEIKALRNEPHKRATSIQLSASLAEIDEILRREGLSLQPLYSKIPALLRAALNKTDRAKVPTDRDALRSNYDQAINIVERLACKKVYVYANLEPWFNYIMSIKYTDKSRPIVESNRLIQEYIKRNLVGERLFGEKEILIS